MFGENVRHLVEYEHYNEKIGQLCLGGSVVEFSPATRETGVAVSILPQSQYSSMTMRMRASAVLHNNISAWSELSPFSRWLSLLHKRTQSLQNFE